MKNSFIFFVLILSVMGCKNKQKTNADSIPKIPVISAKRAKATFNNNIVANIQAIKNVEIRSRINGYLEQILVDEGKEVRKGQPLFKLSSPEYSAELTKAQAMLTRAIAEEKASNLEVERVRMLVEKKVLAATEIVIAESKSQIARAAVSEAQASLKNAEAFLAYTTLNAPFDGVINRIPLKIGSLIKEGDLLTTLSDITSIYTYFYLPETEYLMFQKAKRGDSIPVERTVSLILADGSIYKQKGVIETVASEIDVSTGAIAFRARFSNADKLLKHGASGTIKLENEVDHVILIPQKAVLEIQDKNYLMIVDEDNRVRLRNVQLGQRIGTNYLLKQGVEENERLVYEGVQILREGDRIDPINKSI